jgi:hypothetical protein
MMQKTTSSVNKGKIAEYKHQTENAVYWKFFIATVSVDLISQVSVLPSIDYEPCTHNLCACDIFHNVTRRQVILPVARYDHHRGCGFLSSVGNINFFQMFLGQSD